MTVKPGETASGKPGAIVGGRRHLVLAAVWLVACSNAPVGTSGGTALTSSGAPGTRAPFGDAGTKIDGGAHADAGSHFDAGPVGAGPVDATDPDDAAAAPDFDAADPQGLDSTIGIESLDAFSQDAKLQDGALPADAWAADAPAAGDVPAGDVKASKDGKTNADAGPGADSGDDDAPASNLPIADATESPPDAAPNSVCAKKVGSVSVTETVGGAGKVDLVFFVDTSGSMTEEAAWVSQNLNGFATWLLAQNLDVHVVLVGKTMGNVKLCIDPPLAKAACGTAGANFLQVTDYVASNDGLSKLLAAYPKFQAFLRPDASKSIIAITDDNSSMTAVAFTNALSALQNPGFGKGWVFHSIVSFLNPDPAVAQAGKGCATGAQLGKVYLTLTKQTGGVAFQLCQKDWKPIFDQLAKSVAAAAKPVCSYAIPWPDGKPVATAGMKVLHTEPQGLIEPLQPVAAAMDCQATPTGWYADNSASPKQITVCPQTCQAMNGGFLVFDFGCP